jgi:hypothetical protein
MATEGGGDDWGRQLTRREKVLWYGLAAVTYIAASIVQKSLLNWFVGPLWLVVFVWLGPLLTDRVRHRRRSRAPGAGAEARSPGAP